MSDPKGTFKNHMWSFIHEAIPAVERRCSMVALFLFAVPCYSRKRRQSCFSKAACRPPHWSTMVEWCSSSARTVWIFFFVTFLLFHL